MADFIFYILVLLIVFHGYFSLQCPLVPLSDLRSDRRENVSGLVNDVFERVEEHQMNSAWLEQRVRDGKKSEIS